MLVELPNGNWVTPETVHIAVNGGGDVWSVHILRSSGFSTYYANFGTEAEARAHAGELARMLNAAQESANVDADRAAGISSRPRSGMPPCGLSRDELQRLQALAQ